MVSHTVDATDIFRREEINFETNLNNHEGTRRLRNETCAGSEFKDLDVSAARKKGPGNQLLCQIFQNHKL